MKKSILYIFIILAGIVMGFFAFSDKFESNFVKQEKQNLLAYEKPIMQTKNSFIHQMKPMIGKEIVINGSIKEVYKNADNELVIYLKADNIPLIIHCSISNPESQIFKPLKLNSNLSLRGTLVKITENLYIDNCEINSNELTLVMNPS